MKAHTKGPWRHGTPSEIGTLHANTVYAADGNAIAQVYGVPNNSLIEEVSDGRWDEGLANAQLIASAPDMCAALDRIDATLREFEGMTSTAHKYMAACIRKAMRDDPRDMEQEARDTNERG